MLKLENESLCIRVKPTGAELCSIYSKTHRLEYMWQAGDAWPKHAPVLFPVVGQLKNNSYTFRGHNYSLNRHGFARERHFTLNESGPDRIFLRLSHDSGTLKHYPFPFHFDVEYHLTEDEVVVTYRVVNCGTEPMWFSLGGHPAFRVPMDIRDRYEDHYLEFSHDEDSPRFLLQGGLLSGETSPVFSSRRLELTKDLFHNDAIVLKGIKSDKVSLRSAKHEHGLTVNLNGCPYLGIWAARGADFVCIEPWHGIADSVNATGDIVSKEGICFLPAGDVFSYRWGIEVF